MALHDITVDSEGSTYTADLGGRPQKSVLARSPSTSAGDGDGDLEMSRCCCLVSSGSGCHRAVLTRPAAVMAVLLTLLPSGLLAQPPPQQPSFRAGVDLIEIDVTVVNGQGQPVEDLRAPEFTVSVDGLSRRVATAEFINLRAETPEGRPASADAGEGFYSSNTESTRGRLILLMIDRQNMSFGAGSNVTRAAARFVETLTGNDRVALITLPQPGPLVNFTAHHDLVRDAVDGLVGLRQPPQSTLNIGVYEAHTLVNAGPAGRLVAMGLMERLCGQYEQGTLERGSCENNVASDARRMVQEQRIDSDDSFRALESILDALRAIDGPKHLVWISEGLVLDGPGAVIRPIERAAAAARTTIHVLLVDLPPIDASVRGLPPTPAEDRMQKEQGLRQLAAMTRGDLRRVGPNADAAFEQLETAISGYYLLGVESLSSDQDGEAHEIDVSVLRRGARVRARRAFLIPTPDDESDVGIDERMQRVLQAPFVATGLPLRLATYVFQAEDAEKVRVLVPVEIDALESSPSEVAIGFSLRDSDGNMVSSGRQRATLTPVERPRGPVLEYVVAFVVDPGIYVAKLAVADGYGRSGSVEHPVQAWQLADLPFASGDLVLADASAPSANGWVAPVEARLTGNRLAVYTALYSDEPTTLDGVQVRIEVTGSASGRSLVTVTGVPAPGDQPNSRVVSAIVPIDRLPPGRYVARAVVTRDDESLAQLSRGFQVTRPLAPGGTPTPGVASAAADAMMPVAASPDVVRRLLGEALAFQGEDLLSTQVIGFFMDRLDERRPALEAVTSEARAGNLTGIGLRAFETGDQMAAAFLQGLDLFAQSKWNRAATQFSAALRMVPDFAPASFYLGACYAVGGRDREAATEWRRALLATETAPVEHGALADALLRTGQSREAIVLLRDALSVWPGDDALLKRLAIALALALEYGEAFAVIEPYVERHPTDRAALLLALVTMFSGHVDGSAPLDGDSLERMRAYGDAYGTEEGPHLGLVLDWVRFVSR